MKRTARQRHAPTPRRTSFPPKRTRFASPRGQGARGIVHSPAFAYIASKSVQPLGNLLPVQPIVQPATHPTHPPPTPTPSRRAHSMTVVPGFLQPRLLRTAFCLHAARATTRSTVMNSSSSSSSSSMPAYPAISTGPSVSFLYPLSTPSKPTHPHPQTRCTTVPTFSRARRPRPTGSRTSISRRPPRCFPQTNTPLGFWSCTAPCGLALTASSWPLKWQGF